MPTQISGSTGVSKVQDGVVVTADIADLAITPEKMSQKMTLMQSVDVTTLSDKTKCDFTGIPSWAKRITVMFNGVSTSGSSIVQIQFGAGAVDTSGYASGASNFATDLNITSGIPLSTSWFGTITFFGKLELTNMGGNIWLAHGAISMTGAASAQGNTWFSTGGKALSGALDRVRITTVNGTDTFDAGSINVLYEG